MKHYYWLVIGLCILTMSTTVFASWEATFPSEAAGTYVVGDQKRVLVAAAGEGGAPAADAFADALRESGKAALVMDDNALGNIATLDDAAIVAKAKSLPVDYVGVVRVFPGSAGDTVVIVIYNKQNEVISAINGRENTAIAAYSGETSDGGQGVSASAAAAVSTLTDSGSADENAIKEYEEKRIWFGEWAAINQYGTVVSTWSVPYKGKYKEPLRGANFYSTVGRDDLAKQYKKRTAIKLGVMGAGLAMVIPGMVLILKYVFDDEKVVGCRDETVDDLSNCPVWDEITEKKKGKLVAGAVLAGVGYVAMMVPLFFKSHPVDAPTGRRLADEYNTKLRKELGLPEDESQIIRKRATFELSSLRGGAFFSENGGGLSLKGNFNLIF